MKRIFRAHAVSETNRFSLSGIANYTFSSLGDVLARTNAAPHSARTSYPLVQGPGLCSWPTMRGM